MDMAPWGTSEEAVTLPGTSSLDDPVTSLKLAGSRFDWTCKLQQVPVENMFRIGDDDGR